MPDCQLADWGDWDGCSVQCGVGERSRRRAAADSNQFVGRGCSAYLSEIAQCSMPGCGTDIDCQWNEWAEWDACTCSCGGGQRNRQRTVKETPKGKGQLCYPYTTSEVSACNTQSCAVDLGCVDGKWGDWNAFGECSASCGGGVNWRYRNIAIEANKCGTPAVGTDREFGSCNTQDCSQAVECIFRGWEDWSACSAAENCCYGIKTRDRGIARYGTHDNYCRGHTKEIDNCQSDTVVCDNTTQDCILSDWAAWGACIGECGTGQNYRQRSVVQKPNNGGRACDAMLKETGGCPLVPCQKTEGPECKWGDWSPWAECDRCDGQRKRFRHIITPPAQDGTPCEPGAAEEIDKCPNTCEQKLFCAWSSWEDEGDCSATCGSATRKRVRYLLSSAEKPPIAVLQRNEDIPMLSTSVGLQGVVLGFASGSMISLLFVAVGFRAVRSPSANSVAAVDRRPQRDMAMELL